MKKLLGVICLLLLPVIYANAEIPLGMISQATPTSIQKTVSEQLVFDAPVTVMISGSEQEASAYTLTLLSPRAELEPTCFSESSVKAATFGSEKTEDWPFATFEFENGDTVLYDIYQNISWACYPNGAIYQQLFSFDSRIFAAKHPDEPLGFMTPQEARDAARSILERMKITNPVVAETYAMDMSEIKGVTEELTADTFHKAAAFKTVSEEDEAYFVILRHMFDGIQTISPWESYICVNKNGVVAGKIKDCTRSVSQAFSRDTILSFDEAIKAFEEFHKGILHKIIVDHIWFGYGENLEKYDYALGTRTYELYWRFDYRVKPALSPVAGDKAAEIRKSLYINAFDGTAAFFR